MLLAQVQLFFQLSAPKTGRSSPLIGLLFGKKQKSSPGIEHSSNRPSKPDRRSAIKDELIQPCNITAWSAALCPATLCNITAWSATLSISPSYQPDHELRWIARFIRIEIWIVYDHDHGVIAAVDHNARLLVPVSCHGRRQHRRRRQKYGIARPASHPAFHSIHHLLSYFNDFFIINIVFLCFRFQK